MTSNEKYCKLMLPYPEHIYSITRKYCIEPLLCCKSCNKQCPFRCKPQECNAFISLKEVITYIL